MSTQVQYRRGTTSENNAFTGALAEITVDTTNNTLRVHDGVTAGGFPVAGTTATQTLTNKTLNAPTFTGAVTGNLVPSVNNAYTLGNATSSWSALYVAGNTIYLGDIQLKSSGNSLAIFGADGVTTGNIAVSSLSSGTSVIGLASSGGNAYVTVDGTANVLVVSSTGANIAGTVNATGNANVGNLGTAGLITATGNITGGNLVTAGLASVTGNITGGNLVTAGQVSATGNITGGNLVTAGLASVGTTLSVTGNATAGNLGTGGQVTATGNITGGNLVTAGQVSATGNVNAGAIYTTGPITSGSHTVIGNVVITGNVDVTGNLNYSNVTDLVVGDPLIYIGEDNFGNVVDLGMIVSWQDSIYQHGGWVRDASDGVWKLFGNVVDEPTTVVDFTNAIYQPMRAGAITSLAISATGNISATANVSGGNLSTAGIITATGNVTGGNLTTAGQVVASGNVSGNFFIGNGSQLSGIDATSIQSGTSNVRVVSSGGNVTVGIAGTPNVVVISNQSTTVTGNLLGNMIFTANHIPSGANINQPGYNGLMAGPLTIANGASFTVTTTLTII